MELSSGKYSSWKFDKLVYLSIPKNKIVYCDNSYSYDDKIIDSNTVEFTEPQYTISPGQSLVIYNGNECLGGGILLA